MRNEVGVHRQRQFLMLLLQPAGCTPDRCGDILAPGDFGFPLGARTPIGDSSLPAVMVFHLVVQGITKHHTLHAYSCVILFLRLVPHLPAAQRRLHFPLRDRLPATIAHTLEGLPRFAGVSFVRNACSIRLPFKPTSQHDRTGCKIGAPSCQFAAGVNFDVPLGGTHQAHEAPLAAHLATGNARSLGNVLRAWPTCLLRHCTTVPTFISIFQQPASIICRLLENL